MALFIKKQQPWLAQAVLDGAERPASPSQGQLVQVIDVAPDATLLLVSDTRHQVWARLHCDCDARDVRVGSTIVITSFMVRTSAVVSLTSAPHFYLLVSTLSVPSRTVLNVIGQPTPLTDQPGVNALLQRCLGRCSVLRPDLLEHARADALDLLESESDGEIPPDQLRRLEALPGWTLPPLQPAAAAPSAAARSCVALPLEPVPAAASACVDADELADGSQQPSECSPLAPIFAVRHLVLDRGPPCSQPLQSLSPGGGEVPSPPTIGSTTRARASAPASAGSGQHPRVAPSLRRALLDGGDARAARPRAASPLGTHARRSKRLRLRLNAIPPADHAAARVAPKCAPLWLIRQLCVPLGPAPLARPPGAEPAPVVTRESAEVVDVASPATRAAIARAAAFTQRIDLSLGRPAQSAPATQSLPASESAARPPPRVDVSPERTPQAQLLLEVASVSRSPAGGAESDLPCATSEGPHEATESFAQDESELLDLRGEALRRGSASGRKLHNLTQSSAGGARQTTASVCPTWLLRELICLPRASLLLSALRPELRNET